MRDYHDKKGHPGIFNYLLFRIHMVNIKEMLLTLSFEKASFSNSKKDSLQLPRVEIHLRQQGQVKHTMKMATGILRLSENEQYLCMKF